MIESNWQPFTFFFAKKKDYLQNIIPVETMVKKKKISFLKDWLLQFFVKAWHELYCVLIIQPCEVTFLETNFPIVS